jgi:outer membrane protein assembly factor BamA
MAGISRIAHIAMCLCAGAALAAGTPRETTYILNGYDLSGIPGVSANALQAKLKDKPGARITQADIHADTLILSKELQALHVKGQLFTTLAEKKGRVWIIFDLLNLDAQSQWGTLKAQNFEGAIHVSAEILAKATGLKNGDQLTREKFNVARQAIIAAYAKSMPGKKITLKARLQRRPGEASVTWIIGESK